MQQRDERVTRLLEKHRAVLETSTGREMVLEQLMQRKEAAGSRGRRLLRKTVWLSWRLLLLYAFCSVSLNYMENTFPSVSFKLRTGRALSYLNLVYLKSYRWATVQLGFYRSEFMHSRDREACLVPNPLYQPPVMCCGCQPVRIGRVNLNSPAGRDTFRRAVDRHATPFLVADSGHRPVTYPELRQVVLDAWQDVSAGSNRLAASPGGPTTLSGLMESPERPPAVKLSNWTYGHMSAIRAIRKAVPRPPFVRPDIDCGFARAFYMFGEVPDADDAPVSLGDLSQFQGLSIMLGLHGSVRVTLSAKPECCPGSHGNASALLEPGQAFVVPNSCYRVHVAKQGGGYAMTHLFSVFSSTGIKQPAPITGRVAENDETDEY